MNFPPFVTKNNLRGIRMGKGPIWGVALLPLNPLLFRDIAARKEHAGD